MCIQPDKIQHSALLTACHESRREICKRFEKFPVRNDNGECALMFIETSKDTLYLNRRLKGLQNSGTPQRTVWMATQVMYDGLLQHITSLAMNLELMKKHTSAFRGGRHNISLDLHMGCPRLSTLTLVACGSLRPDKHKLFFNPVAHEDLNIGDRRLLKYTLSSFDKARVDGYCTGIMLDLVAGKPISESCPEALGANTYGIAHIDMYG